MQAIPAGARLLAESRGSCAPARTGDHDDQVPQRARGGSAPADVALHASVESHVTAYRVAVVIAALRAYRPRSCPTNDDAVRGLDERPQRERNPRIVARRRSGMHTRSRSIFFALPLLALLSTHCATCKQPVPLNFAAAFGWRGYADTGRNQGCCRLSHLLRVFSTGPAVDLESQVTQAPGCRNWSQSPGWGVRSVSTRLRRRDTWAGCGPDFRPS